MNPNTQGDPWAYFDEYQKHLVGQLIREATVGLLTKAEKDKHTLLVSLEAATKEIERMTEQAIRFRDLCLEKDRLLTECAGALALVSHGIRDDELRVRIVKLFTRVREATK
jgi:hypothetical protein